MLPTVPNKLPSVTRSSSVLRPVLVDRVSSLDPKDSEISQSYSNL
jgi:hypothetical protein